MLKFLKSLTKKKNEADAAYKTRNYQDAITLYKEAIQMYIDTTTTDSTEEHFGLKSLNSPAYLSKLYFNLASSHASIREHEQVIENCTSAIKLDDSYLKAYMRRAASHLVLAEESNCNKAIQDYEKALNLVSEMPPEQQKQQSIDIKKKIREAQVQLKRAKRKDFYKILGVPKDATDNEIKKCYRKLALKWHPDRHANSTEEKKKEAENTFRDVNLAYEVLSDPVKKRKYDSGVDEQDLDNPHATAGSHGFAHSGGGINTNDIFEMFMRQQGAASRGGHKFHFG